MSNCTSDTSNVYTVRDWLFGCVNFAVPTSAAENILAERGVNGDTRYAERSTLPVDIRLLKADLLKWIVRGPSVVNNTSDSDNGWSHSGGGYKLSKEDKKQLRDEANEIYEELEPASVFGKLGTKVHSLGIMPAMRDLDGNPLPRIDV